MPIFKYTVPPDPSPQYSSGDGKRIDINVFFPHLDETVRYTACESDPGWEHSEELYARASAIDSNISMSTVYRTVKLFEESGIVARRDFGDGRARYEQTPGEHHDHLIDVTSGQVIEFTDPEIEALQEKIAARLGYVLVDHRLELFCRPLHAGKATPTKSAPSKPAPIKSAPAKASKDE